MKKIILLLMLCSSLLISQELDRTGQGFSGGVKIEFGDVYKSLEGEKVWQLAGGISLPLKYTFNTQWIAEINPGLTPISAYSLTMGMRCYYFPFRSEYDKNNFFVFLGLDNAFCFKKFWDIKEDGGGPHGAAWYQEETNSDYIFDRPIVSLLFGTGIQFRESYAFDLSVSIPFNPQYAIGYYYEINVPGFIAYPVKMHVFVRFGVTRFF